MNYGLIDKGYMKVGPRPYTKVFFEDYLVENGINYDLPKSYESLDPIVINDSIKIAPVQDVVIPEYDILTQQLAGPFWNTKENPVTGWYDTAPVEVNAAKEKVKSLLAAVRYQKENSDINIVIQGETVSISKRRGESRNSWTNMLVIMGPKDTKNYKFAGNLWIELTQSDVQLIVTSINQAVQEAFDWELTYLEVIDTSTTLDQIKDIKTKIMPPLPSPEALNGIQL